MLILPLHEVQVGMTLAMSVMNPHKREQELLRAGYTLEADVLEKLRATDVTHVFVEFEGLDDLDAVLAPHLSPQRQAIYQAVKTAIGQSEKANRPAVKYAQYKDATRDFVKTILTAKENAMLLDVLGTSAGEVEHATAVAHLAIVLGLRLEAYLIRERPRLSSQQARDVTNLGVAGMLHDVGKTQLPEALRRRNVFSGLDDHTASWQDHTRLGFEMVRRDVDPTVAATVLNHHQRFDGRGFPALKRYDSDFTPSGNGIHVFARILGAADLYERLACGPGGVRRTNFEVLHLLQTRYANWLDPDVLAVMPQVIPPFSPGRRVTLSDGTNGIVVGFHPFTPYQPLVKKTVNGAVVTSDEAIDLRDTPLEVARLDGQLLDDLRQVARAA